LLALPDSRAESGNTIISPIVIPDRRPGVHRPASRVPSRASSRSGCSTITAVWRNTRRRPRPGAFSHLAPVHIP